jgi:hypothetical protein
MKKNACCPKYTWLPCLPSHISHLFFVPSTVDQANLPWWSVSSFSVGAECTRYLKCPHVPIDTDLKDGRRANVGAVLRNVFSNVFNYVFWCGELTPELRRSILDTHCIAKYSNSSCQTPSWSASHSVFMSGGQSWSCIKLLSATVKQCSLVHAGEVFILARW